MPEFVMGVVVLGMVALKGAALLVIVYVGTRLAIRHERRVAN